MSKTKKIMATPETLPAIARDALKAAGLTQKEAAERLDVAQPNISKAVNDDSGSYVSLQKRIIELAGWQVRGPLWEVMQSENKSQEGLP